MVKNGHYNIRAEGEVCINYLSITVQKYVE